MAFKNLSKIKSLFIVEEESTENKEDKQLKNNIKTEKQETSSIPNSNFSWKTSASSESDGTVSSDTDGNFNQKIFDSLTKAISEANLPGEDYLEFMQGLQAMKDLPMDESLKLKSVFMTLTTKGLTIPKIVESANHYLTVLNQEKTKFYNVIDSQKKNKVESKQKHIIGLENNNKEKAELIKKITDEMAANTKKIQKETAEISVVKAKIKLTEDDFVFTYNKMTNLINDNINKIKEIN